MYLHVFPLLIVLWNSAFRWVYLSFSPLPLAFQENRDPLILIFFFFFKVFIEFVTILFPFHVLVFGHQACGFLVPRPGIKPAPPALGSKVLTTGPPGMSQAQLL